MKIKVGTKVLCRLYNTPDKKFYGDYFRAEVIDIMTFEKLYRTVDDKGFTHVLKRKEIKRILE